jgi:hypothetical protein
VRSWISETKNETEVLINGPARKGNNTKRAQRVSTDFTKHKLEKAAAEQVKKKYPAR